MSDFLEMLADAITVRQLTTPIASSLTFSPDAPVIATHKTLASRRFDYAPVTNGEQVIGRIGQSDLSSGGAGTIEPYVTPLHAKIVVSASSPINDLVSWFSAEPFLLVLDGRDVMGLVTVSDLNKQAARTYLYAVVTGFESALANFLRRHIDDQELAIGKFSSERQQRIRSTVAAAGEQEADYISAMSLPDLLDLTRKCDLLGCLGFDSAQAWKTQTGPLVQFRNGIAHATKPIVTSNADIEKVNKALASLQELYGAVVEAETGK